MKIKACDPCFDIYKDPETQLKYGAYQHGYELDFSSKELRKIGFDIGYGVTKGCITAYVAVSSLYYACKAIKHYIDKHSTIQEPQKDPEQETEEAAEK